MDYCETCKYNDLSPKQFKRFMDDISMMLSDYEDYEQEDE